MANAPMKKISSLTSIAYKSSLDSGLLKVSNLSITMQICNRLSFLTDGIGKSKLKKNIVALFDNVLFKKIL